MDSGISVTGMPRRRSRTIGCSSRSANGRLFVLLVSTDLFHQSVKNNQLED